MRIILLVIPACLLALTEARRVQIRPRVTEPQVYYEEHDNQAAEDEFDTVAVYQPRTRALPSPRSKDALHGSKPPPVQTIRNYNKVNDDGSFTFGYEAADGSFKEETRGTDCVVRGKYGYIDPDGNKREFTYVSGNPCDPNAPKDEEEEEPPEKEEEDLPGPANYPVVRPIPRPVSVRPTYHPTTTRAPTTIFQTEYQLDDDASQELTEDDLKPQLRPSAFRRPATLVSVTPSTSIYESSQSPSPQSIFRLASTPAAQYQTTATPVLRSQPTVTSSVYQSLETTTRRPVTRHPRPQSVAITPRPHVAQVAAQYVSPSSTERPSSLLYAQTHPTISPLRTTTAASTPHLDFAAELERYVNTVGSHVPAAPVARPQTASPQTNSRVKLTGQTTVTAASAAAEPIYQSELVYDPATGQYNTQLYQTLPQTVGDFSLSHKLQPFVAQPQSLLGLQQLQQYQQAQRPVYKQAQSAPTPTVTQPQEVLYRKQQAQLLQQSQQLYAQQQRRQQQQQQQHQQQHQQQPHRLQLLESQREPQAFYYVAPLKASSATTSLSVGQIDQFLRGSGANNY
ncbi:PREDICTED: putative mediator of RNA polymerase II transcription subunit 12 [Vollenhovia emeryi]|uniref:putative mediator of RNA polymerase II transcription subunit 12 n=1 Tax=Vollenhovia emeryi TaxID=411798 RepID=UPI0005F4A884|nr:PREDICTED: putative mediator of RNA polymerase II transcription subunit 12 [Vollenhovia emeryi]